MTINSPYDFFPVNTSLSPFLWDAVNWLLTDLVMFCFTLTLLFDLYIVFIAVVQKPRQKSHRSIPWVCLGKDRVSFPHFKCLSGWCCHLFKERCKFTQPLFCPKGGHEYWEVKGDVYEEEPVWNMKDLPKSAKNCFCVPFASFSSSETYQEATWDAVCMESVYDSHLLDAFQVFSLRCNK